ncbi:hypothetical protein GQ651_02290 [Alphaproteobacteria bacterium GH1-50]|uniref:BPL/LPL catalytic domain-containing protein n=1 Tax=Kangsaoukella pontilimi TaxID=2691042 RepID=A0A7C9IEC2_9RHOB|nr:hypothetical protein [Kangsaoukella pontilimi]
MVFPPLLTGIAVAGDPVAAARESVAIEVEPGSVFYGTDATRLEAAIVLAPEEALADALPVAFAVALGLNDAIGALAPPEVALHLVWPDRIRINGALCGRMRAFASTGDPKEEPDWLIVALDVPLLTASGVEPGETPDETCLYEEGCGDITSHDLTDAWARHMMNWLHIFLTEGFAPLHEEWRAKAHGLGTEVTYPEHGTFIGLDEKGGMLLKRESGETALVPLTRLLAV